MRMVILGVRVRGIKMEGNQAAVMRFRQNIGWRFHSWFFVSYHSGCLGFVEIQRCDLCIKGSYLVAKVCHSVSEFKLLLGGSEQTSVRRMQMSLHPSSSILGLTPFTRARSSSGVNVMCSSSAVTHCGILMFSVPPSRGHIADKSIIIMLLAYELKKPI